MGGIRCWLAAATVSIAGPASANCAEARWQALCAQLADATYGVPGGALIVHHNGVEVFRQNFGNKAGTAFDQVGQPIASVSKTYAAVTVLRVDEDTRVPAFSIDDLVSKHYPGWSALAKKPGWNAMTIRQLISMTGGVVSGAGCFADGSQDFKACTDLMLNTYLSGNAAPGQRFHYAGPGWNVAATATMAAIRNGYGSTNTSWAAELNWYLSRPCGWQVTGFGAYPNVKASGDMVTNLDEGGEMAELLRTGWCRDSANAWRRILSPETLAKMRGDQVGQADKVKSAWSYSLQNRHLRSYGYGLWRNDAGPLTPIGQQLYFGAGLFGSHIFFNTQHGYSGFLLIKDPNDTNPDTEEPASFGAATPFFEETVRNIHRALVPGSQI